MQKANTFHRYVCDRCMTMAPTQGICPKCGHAHMRTIIIHLQDGRRNGTRQAG
ncbi:hypothetical protein ACTID9_14515 [Brevibacillus fluminis]|uniref:hypothetical protein n=1 Tax=Brevibacillus fluminis TaxID=511487 RepID=UPI003F891D10